jgi:hypothetical protein
MDMAHLVQKYSSPEFFSRTTLSGSEKKSSGLTIVCKKPINHVNTCEFFYSSNFKKCKSQSVFVKIYID